MDGVDRCHTPHGGAATVTWRFAHTEAARYAHLKLQAFVGCVCGRCFSGGWMDPWTSTELGTNTAMASAMCPGNTG